MLNDASLLLAMCLSATISIDNARTEAPRYVAIAAEPDGSGTEATATLPTGWSAGDLAVVLVSTPNDPRRQDGTIPILLSFGIGVIDWQPQTGSDATLAQGSAETWADPATASRIAARLGAAERGAALRVDPISGLPSLVAEWGMPSAGSADPLACALDAVLASRGHDARFP